MAFYLDIFLEWQPAAPWSHMAEPSLTQFLGSVPDKRMYFGENL